MRLGVDVVEADVEKMESLKKSIARLDDMVTFLTTIDKALEKMKLLLFTPNNSDMHEAINFFVTAYQFNIDGTLDGIMGEFLVKFGIFC